MVKRINLKQCLQLWFLFSLTSVFFLTGWHIYKSAYNYNWWILCITVVILGYMLLRQPLRIDVQNIAISVFVAGATFFLGGFVGAQQIYFNEWMEGSLAQFSESVLAANLLLKETDAIEKSESGPEQITKRNHFLAGLDLRYKRLTYPVLMAFDRKDFRLVFLDKNKIATILPDQKVKHVLNLQPDGNVIFTHYDDRTMVRSKLKNGRLQEVWRRRHSKIYWHHWGAVFQGKFYQPGRYFMDLPNDISRSFDRPYTRCDIKNGVADVIYVFDYDNGQLLRTLDLLPLIDGMKNEEHRQEIRNYMTNCQDPLHLNAVELLKNKQEAGYFPAGKVGDMLISLRDIHALLLLDRDTGRVKWSVVGGDNGKFKHQHSPLVTDRGTVLVFDNKGSDAPNGLSRIVELDIATGELTGYYEARGNEYFQSEIRGKIKLLPDGRILVSQEKNNRTYPGKDHVALFVLDCSDQHVSDNCERIDIFTSKSDAYNFHNAVMLTDKD